MQLSTATVSVHRRRPSFGQRGNGVPIWHLRSRSARTTPNLYRDVAEFRRRAWKRRGVSDCQHDMEGTADAASV